MPNVEWSYHRNGCKTCGKTQTYLTTNKVAVKEQIIANKVPLAHDKIDELVASVNEIYATKGTKLIHLDLKNDQPEEEMLYALLIGPSGKLRAPTLKVGKTLLVGYDESAYQAIFGR